jgi:NitT/TauT family transport system permease protein
MDSAVSMPLGEGQVAFHRRSGLLDALARRRTVLITLALIMVAWQLGPRLLALPTYLLPPPSTVLMAFLEQWQRALNAAWITTTVMLGGFIAAAVFSTVFAVLIVSSQLVEDAIQPILLVFQVVPKIAIAPLFIVWFGFGWIPETVLVFLMAFFPITLSAVAGLKSADPDILDLARSTGASTWAMFRKIKLPQALPEIFTGLKVGITLASTGAITAEFIASDRGIGYLLLEWRADLNTPMVFAGIFLISAAGLLLYYVIEVIEHVTIPWHVSQRRDISHA